MVNAVLEGYHACVFAYGQTGTGKTYTMEGQKGGTGFTSMDTGSSGGGGLEGIQPRALRLLLSACSAGLSAEKRRRAPYLAAQQAAAAKGAQHAGRASPVNDGGSVGAGGGGGVPNPHEGYERRLKVSILEIYLDKVPSKK